MRLIYLAALIFLFLLIPGSPALAAEPDPQTFQEGREYFKLPEPAVLLEPDDGRVEVTAFFWYGCQSCNQLDPFLDKWVEEKLPPDKVRFTMLPMTDAPPLDVHARLFLTIEALGLGRQAHRAIFDLFQTERQPINEPAQLDILASKLGLEAEKVRAAYESAEVEARFKRLEEIMKTYNVLSVPSMVIDGRYNFDLATAHGLKGYLGLTERLVKEAQAGPKADRREGAK